VENEATNTGYGQGNGGAVLIRRDQYGYASGVLVNNIFYNNLGHGPANKGNSVACYGYPDPATASVYYCDAFPDMLDPDYHYTPPWVTVGPGNLYVDPLFVNSASNFHLQYPGQSVTSPMDWGHDLGDSPYDKVPATDWHGLPNVRPVDIDDQLAPNRPYATDTTDMGCYERQQ
jgi:hypothetical protein